jgi:DNA excision repair protein ERCC-2
MTAASKPIVSVSVRKLVDYVLRSGGLGGDGGFSSLDRARAGMRGQKQLQSSRPAEYETEVPIVCEVEFPNLTLRVQGRMDGFLRTESCVHIEEIKTVMSFDASGSGPDPLHQAQLKMYAALWARQEPGVRIETVLTYLNLETNEVRQYDETPASDALARFLDEVTSAYAQWAEELQNWRVERDRSLHALAFPYPAYRAGQRELAVAAYRTLSRGGRLFAEAPTGIGKTISVLFPALKALGEGRFVRLFYLTAKTIGRVVAEKALSDLRDAGARLRSVTLTAKEKICFNGGAPCDLNTCPYAIGYYDRLKQALREVLSVDALTRSAIEDAARRHQVCPFELSLDAALWVDVIVCDYNYVFDPTAYLKRFFAEDVEDCAFLIDEAHNLIDRAREMFSASLDKASVLELKKAVKDAAPDCAKALGRVSRAMNALTREEKEDEDQIPADDLFASSEGSVNAPEAARRIPGRPRLGREEDLRVVMELPEELLPPLRQFVSAAGAWLMREKPAAWRESLLELYFEVAAFLRIAEMYGDGYATLIRSGRKDAAVRLFCMDPSGPLRQALERACATVFFSATLAPLEYYRDLLGGGLGDEARTWPSPFPRDNLRLLIQDRISTLYKERANSVDEVARSIAALIQPHPGNYMVYFPSYEYLNQVRAQFEAICPPECRLLTQVSGMKEPEREAFMAAFDGPQEGTLLGFAVMGGIFGEGIDLTGDRLVGAIIVGVGMPQLCLERDLIQDYFQKTRGTGFDFAYTFPGMNRVLQAAGRVIRGETDRGVVMLVDTRFAQGRYRRLFPAWWQPHAVRGEDEILCQARQFWEGGAMTSKLQQ